MATSVTKEETETLSLSPSAEILWKWPEAERAIRWQRGSNQCSLVAFASLWAQKQVNVARKADFSLSWLMIRSKLSLHTCSHTLRALTDSMVERHSGSEALQVTLDGLPDVTHKIRLSLCVSYICLKNYLLHWFWVTPTVSWSSILISRPICSSHLTQSGWSTLKGFGTISPPHRTYDSSFPVLHFPPDSCIASLNLNGGWAVKKYSLAAGIIFLYPKFLFFSCQEERQSPAALYWLPQVEQNNCYKNIHCLYWHLLPSCYREPPFSSN